MLCFDHENLGRSLSPPPFSFAEKDKSFRAAVRPRPMVFKWQLLSHLTLSCSILPRLREIHTLDRANLPHEEGSPLFFHFSRKKERISLRQSWKWEPRVRDKGRGRGVGC